MIDAIVNVKMYKWMIEYKSEFLGVKAAQRKAVIVLVQ
jgi:hypothetical protein